MIAYVHRNCISVAEENIRSDLCLSKEEMGWVMGAFFLTYALGQVPTGWLSHLWGSRRALPFFTAVWSITTQLLVFAAGLPGLLLARLGMGAAQAGLLPAATDTISKWLPPTRRAVASGALASFMSVGSVLAAVLTGVLLQYLSWQTLFMLFAVPGFVWALGFLVWFRDRPQEHRAVNAAEVALIQGGMPAPAAGAAPAVRTATPWGAIVTSAAMWSICGQQFFRAAGYNFFASWFPTFLKESRGVSTAESGLLTSLPLLAVVLGSFLGGVVSDAILVRTGSRRLSRQGVSIASTVTCAVLIVVSYFLHNALLAVLVISAGAFVASFAAPCAYAITIDMAGEHVAPVFSTMNMSGNLGALAFPVVVPWLIDWTGGWDAVLFVFAGLYLAAAFFWMLLNPTGTIFDRRGNSLLV
jgi:MFS family permease